MQSRTPGQVLMSYPVFRIFKPPAGRGGWETRLIKLYNGDRARLPHSIPISLPASFRTIHLSPIK
jgi:hypothetical protein